MSYDAPQIGLFRQPFVGSVASGCRVCSNYASETSASQWMSRTRHRAAIPLTSAGNVRVGLPAFLVLTSYVEANFGTAAVNYTCAIEYPSGTIVAQATFGGSVTGTQPGNTSILFTDPLALSGTIPAGAYFFVRIWGQNTKVIPYWSPTGTGADTANGEGFLFTSNGTTPDITMTAGANVGMSNTTGFRPCCIVGTTTKASVIINGDSIGAGVHDTFSGTSGDVGLIERALGLANIAYINLSISGEAAYNYNASNACRESLAAFGSHRVIEYGINDLNIDAKLDVATRQAIVALKNLTPNMPTFLTTLFPVCTSSDGFITQSNQTCTAPFTGSGYDVRQQHNAWRRGIPPGFAGCFDTASVLEQGNTGKWQAPGGIAWTNEGIHPNPTSYGVVATSGIIPPSAFS